MKAPAVASSGRGDTLSIPAPLGFRHHDGTPITYEDAAHIVRVLTERNTARSKVLRSLEAQGRQCDPHEYAALSREARLDALRVRVWSGLEVLAREAAVLL